MTDLTEQFNNNEIDESKLYYFKQKMSEEIEIGHPFSLNMVRAMDDTYLDWFLIDKILAPVPTFDEWQESEKYNKHLEEVIKIYERKDKQATETSIAYNELLEEYQKLKESRAELNSDIADKAYENAMLKSEYEKECKRADELEDSYWKAEKENKKFKELLKKARDILEDEGDYMIVQKIDKELEK